MTAPAVMPVKRVELVTHDADEVTTFVNQRYLRHRSHFADRGSFELRARSATAGALSADQVWCSMTSHAVTDSDTQLWAVQVLSGRLEATAGRNQLTMGP